MKKILLLLLTIVYQIAYPTIIKNGDCFTEYARGILYIEKENGSIFEDDNGQITESRMLYKLFLFPKTSSMLNLITLDKAANFLECENCCVIDVNFTVDIEIKDTERNITYRESQFKFISEEDVYDMAKKNDGEFLFLGNGIPNYLVIKKFKIIKSSMSVVLCKEHRPN